MPIERGESGRGPGVFLQPTTADAALEQRWRPRPSDNFPARGVFERKVGVVVFRLPTL